MKKSIKMLSTVDGHDENESGQVQPCKTFIKGEIYLVSESLYNCFKEMKVCEDAEQAKGEKPSSENKDNAKSKPTKPAKA